MDQTSFSLLVGLLVGFNIGAIGLPFLTGRNSVDFFGGVVGFFLFTVLTYQLVGFLGRRNRKK
jgi:biotin transporter BioY